MNYCISSSLNIDQIPQQVDAAAAAVAVVAVVAESEGDKVETE